MASSWCMPIRVTYDDGHSLDVVAKPKDIVAFERQYGVPFAQFLDDNAMTEWIFYLAWSPLHRQNREQRAFDEFMSVVDDVTMLADEDEASAEGQAAPFAPAPSEGSSQS